MRRNVRDSRVLWRAWIAASVVLFVLAGCGRPATKADCDEILDKSAMFELQMQHVTDPAEIKKRTEAVRAAQGEQLLGKCVGRRITDKAMSCVRNATSAEQVDRCLD